MPSLLVAPEAKFDRRHHETLGLDPCMVSDTKPSSKDAFDLVHHDFDAHAAKPAVEDGRPRVQGACITLPNPGIPQTIAKKLLELLPVESRRSLRLTCKAWSRVIDSSNLLTRPAANAIPAEILLQIFLMLSPRDFDNARRTCSQWMRISLNEVLLEGILKKAGWWNSWLCDCRKRRPSQLDTGAESLVWRMSRRFATECVLSGRKMNVERTGFLTTTFIDFSHLLQWIPWKESPSPHAIMADAGHHQTNALTRPMSMIMFHVSNCGNYLMVPSGNNIYIYRLLTRGPGQPDPSMAGIFQNADIVLVATIACPARIVSATMDSSSSKLVVAASSSDRTGLVCDLISCCKHSESTTSRHSRKYGIMPMNVASQYYFNNLGSTGDPPRSVSICPGRRCIAFGSGAGIQLRWFNDKAQQWCERSIPMSQSSDVLHFLSSRHEDTSTELRLISSLAGPRISACGCHRVGVWDSHRVCPHHDLTDNQHFTRPASNATGNLNVIRATHCPHYHAIPLSDGLHILFIEPRTNLLCMGSDAHIGGPTSLTRALVCVPPFGESSSDPASKGVAPDLFAAGSDMSWGLRIVAVYGDQLVLYSVPLDVFNVIRKEYERQGDNVMADSDLARDWFFENQIWPKQRESLAQNQNGDWEFLLGTSYRSTVMMWPFKIYGKEIGRMDNVVELALQTSNGGARVWTFSASGEANILDVDTFTSSAQPATITPCKSLSVGPDGKVASSRSIDRPTSISPSSQHLQKRDQDELDERACGKHFNPHRLHQHLDKQSQGEFARPPQATNKRTSFAACIVDFNIPELDMQDGVENDY